MKQTAFTIKQKWKTYCHSALLTGTSFNNISNSVEISDNLLGRNITVVHHQLATQVVRIHATLTSELHRLCQDPQVRLSKIHVCRYCVKRTYSVLNMTMHGVEPEWSNNVKHSVKD